MFKTYYILTKPGIIYGNLITTAAGFFLASKGNINFGLLLASLAGVSLVIGSACVFNNYLDRDIDKKMARTKARALARGLVSARNAIVYATFLGLAGFSVLAIYTNLVTVSVGIIGFLDYVVLYSIFKRRSLYGTIIGSISGATPVVAGYTAVTNRIDSAALILFLTLVFWQMAHFYSIAIYRFKDYAAARIPVLPVKAGVHFTKINMVFYIVAFILSAASLTIFGYTRYTYFAVAAVLGLFWLGLCLSGFKTDKDTIWARKMFRFSLITITGLCIMITLDAVR